MATNAYLGRLEQLEGQKAAKLVMSGLPISRPMQEQIMKDTPAGMAGNPKPQKNEPRMDSLFGQMIEGYKGKDSRFEQMLGDYTSLVSSLKNQVDAGMMPEVIARQRMQQYLQDGRKYFAQNKAKPMDNPEVKAMIDGLMEGAMGQAQAEGGEMPPQGGANGPV